MSSRRLITSNGLGPPAADKALAEPVLFLYTALTPTVNTVLKRFARSDTHVQLATGPTSIIGEAAHANVPSGPSCVPHLLIEHSDTQLVDVAALQQNGLLPVDANWASVKLTTNANPGDIMAIASSYDKTLRYGAQTPFSDQLAFHWVGSVWEYDSTHDSIIAVGNGGTQPTQAALILTYNHGTGTYELDQMLQPGQQMWIDVGQLIRSQAPDKNGNILPAALTIGSYEVLQSPRHAGGGSLFEGKVVFDKKYGSVTYGCATCCGYTSSQFEFFFDPLGIPLDGNQDQGVEGYDTCEGAWVDVTSDFDNSWSTANPSIATVNAYGTHTGVAIGSTSTNASADEQVFNERQNCPIEPVYPKGNDNVTVPSSLHVVSVTVLPDGIGPPFGCPGSFWYGIKVDIKYQVFGSDGSPFQQGGMTPHETGTDFTGAALDSNIGPSPGYPTSTGTTASDGTFHDVPFGICANGAITKTATQSITIIMSGTSYPVRSQTFTVNGQSVGHGTISNNIGDISATR